MSDERDLRMDATRWLNLAIKREQRGEDRVSVESALEQAARCEREANALAQKVGTP